jgi:hypothetical protein
MATLDFTPLFRSSVGFDRLPTLLSHALERDEGGYPIYNKRRADKTSTASSWRSPASARTTLKSSSSTIDCVCAASSKTLPDRRTCTPALPAEPSSASSTLPTTSRLRAPRWVTGYWSSTSNASCPRRSSPAAFRSKLAPSCLLAASPPTRSTIRLTNTSRA